VAPKLAELIDVHLDTKQNILFGLWQYIKVFMGLTFPVLMSKGVIL
jgi:chromatin remodeling complex protein RSC6